MDSHSVISRTSAAYVTGASLLLMAVLAAAANFGVVQPNAADLPGFAALQPVGFGLAVAALMVVVFLDVVVAWGLHLVFGEGNLALSGLTAWLWVVYAAVFLVAIGVLGALVGGVSDVPAGLAFTLFDSVWSAGLGLFGAHLLLLAALLMRSRFAPTWLGALVGVAGVGYVADAFTSLVAPGAAFGVGAFTFVGEVVLLVWLLVSARRLPPRPATDVVGLAAG